MSIVSKEVEYQVENAKCNGVLFWDSARGDRRPGVLVVHGGAGLDDHAKEKAVGIADMGYVAFACDMYGEGVAGDRQRVMACLEELRRDREKLCRRGAAGLGVFQSDPTASCLFDGCAAAVGYCFGGMTVLEMARSGIPLRGVASVHGSLATAQRAKAGSIKAKILACHGALDPHVPWQDVTAFVQEMNDARADWRLNVYGGALHGFTHKSPLPVPGVAYNEQADASSTQALKHLFAEVFGGRGSIGG